MNKAPQERINVLVTGGAGSIGSHLCEFLLSREKYNVICVDNYFSGNERNIDRLLSHPHFEFIRHDLAEPLDFSQFPGTERFKVAFVGVQEIYHLAGPDSPRITFKSPLEVMILASQGTKHVLDLALQYRAKVLLASDTLVYGEAPADMRIQENYRGNFDFLDPFAVNAESKRYAEALADVYRRLYSLTIKTVRLHNVYGPHMHFGDGRFIPEMIERALNNDVLTVPSSMTHASFLYVSDAVDALEKVMIAEGMGAYNLAHPSRYTIDEVLQTILRLTGSSSQIQRAESGDEIAQVWERSCRAVDVTRLRDDAGWFPVVLLEGGLLKTIDFMKSMRGLADLRSAH